jgi:hypothetical protein
MSPSNSALTDVDRRILDFLDLADDEYDLTLGGDIASEVGVPGNAIGSRLVSLVKRGYVYGFPVEGHKRLTGWRTSDEYRAGVLPR